ncbi:phage tail length tape measure family protein [Phytobacter palmae]|uniref:Phage tail length tape measure family protein n=1 Tax=Phytobacter palmae TaxID=1855371 RepID=A0ABU9VCW5_9ENTR
MTEQKSRLAIIIDSSGAEKNAESLTSALHGLTEWGQKAAASAGKVTKATDEEKQALSELLDRIDPLNAALNKLDKQQQDLAKFKSKGMVDTETFDLYSKRIEDTRNKLTGFRDDLSKTGMSAKQTAWAMRLIPAQMTDIVVGLSTGQSPFMVLMQQGGQLKDMFGGIGPAIKGVGSYVMGLVTPFTLAAGAVGVLGLAYYKGSQEQDEFYKSLTLTGNQVGKTSGQLADIAARASAAADGTTGVAASALNQLVSSGKVAADSLERVTTAIVKTNDATGIATEQLVSDFNEIATKPVEAITKLNDQYHFLTLATYNQIKALQDEGNQQDAARVASEAYSSSLIQRSADIKNNLGVLESAWNAIAGAAKSAWDSMLDVGREVSIEQKIQNASSELDRAQRSLADLEKGQAANAGPYGAWKSDDIDRQQRVVTLLKQRLSTLQSEKTSQDVLNNSINTYNKRQQEGIEAQERIDKLTEQTLTNAQKRQKALDQLNRDLAKARAAGNSISADEEAKLRANINEKYKDPKTPKGKAYTEDAGTRMLDQLNQQYAALTSQFDTTEKIGAAQQALIKWEQQLADIKSKKTLTADQKSLLASQNEITMQLQKNAAVEKEIALRKDAEKLTAFRNTLTSGLQTDATTLQNDLNSNTVLSQEQKRQQELTKIVSEYQKKRVELTNQRTTGQISQNLYDQETAALQQALTQRLDMQKAYYSQLDQLNSNWQMGVQNGMQSYLNGIPTLYASTTEATTSILNSTQNAISSNLSAMVQGTESLSDGFKNMATGMGQAVIDALTKMAAQWLVYQAVQLLVGKSAAAGAASSLIGQATAMSQIAAINAYASAAAIPVIGWTLAPAAMAAAQAATVPLITGVSAGTTAMVAGAGFMTGGYTGNGAVNSVAGVVHGKEYVFDAASTKRIGLSNLEALRNGGSLDATLGKPGYGTGAQSAGNQEQTTIFRPTINIPPITINGNPSDATVMLVQQAARQGAQQGYQKVVNDLASGRGDVHKSLTTGYATKRRTG